MAFLMYCERLALNDNSMSNLLTNDDGNATEIGIALSLLLGRLILSSP